MICNTQNKLEQKELLQSLTHAQAEYDCIMDNRKKNEQTTNNEQIDDLEAEIEGFATKIKGLELDLKNKEANIEKYLSERDKLKEPTIQSLNFIDELS